MYCMIPPRVNDRWEESWIEMRYRAPRLNSGLCNPPPSYLDAYHCPPYIPRDNVIIIVVIQEKVSDQLGLLAGEGRTLGMNAAEDEPALLTELLQAQGRDDGPDHGLVLGIEDENFVAHGRHVARLRLLEPLHFDGVASDDRLGAHVSPRCQQSMGHSHY